MANYEKDILNYKSSYTTNNDVLKNKLNIEDEELLNQVERMITSYNLTQLYINPGKQTFDVNHYLSIHKSIFNNIYEFAGNIRNETIEKRLPFCLPLYIYPELERTLKEARRNMTKITNREELLHFITVLYSDLDMIHPFREGNGRTEREFIRQLIDYICKTNNLEEYYLDYSKIDNREEFIDALVFADAYLNYTKLNNLFDNILLVKDKEKNLKL